MLPIPSAAAGPAADAECVVLLHGIARSPSAMRKMERKLKESGYIVANIGYDSRKKILQDLMEDVNKKIQSGCKAAPKMHIVGHSMGGLITRAWLKKYRPKNLGRVVMIGTPNHGSEIADFMKNTYFFKSYFGPAGQQLITDQDGFADIFVEKVDFELGIIAGDRSMDPISSVFLLPGKDDGKVSVASTKLDGMKDHIVLHAEHTFMPSNKKVIAQVLHFLQQSTFKHP
ncbi:MAG: alpha/beta fold hydrolase [Alphaproteobacteria bacterium]|nr:alpha/beta fold hydrolase [Alphaproteobacteria bacterium]